MIVFRLTKGEFKDQLSGIGARLYGGRWNSKGFEVVYTCENRALCTAEIAVHSPLGIVPQNYFLQTIRIPECRYETLDHAELPTSWKSFPHSPLTQLLGDSFLKTNQFLMLNVPSAVVQGESNFLLNPNHKLFQKVRLLKTEPFQFDRRLFVK